MTSRQANQKAISEIRAATEAELGRPLDESVFKKALEKAKRWMRNAYGDADLQEYISERGGSVATYYRETEAQPDGRGTHNHQIAAARPRG